MAGEPAVEALVQDRRKTHGDWHTQAACAQAIKYVIHQGNFKDLSPHQQEALEMIAVKMSRILCGDASEPDHWRDIAGYARLGERGHE